MKHKTDNTEISMALDCYIVLAFAHELEGWKELSYNPYEKRYHVEAVYHNCDTKRKSANVSDMNTAIEAYNEY